MTYEESLNYIYSLTNLENTRRFDLMKEGFSNVKKTLEIMGIDYLRKNFIHIAGTKGKGTVSYFSSYLLSKFGKYKVGLYTSPHLLKINERIATLSDGVISEISDEDFAHIATKVKNIKEKYNVPLTTFDFLTIMAIVYFDSVGTDVIVLEVGLGGRLDSTNFCIPRVSVITLIDYDHTNVLGKTLSKIAYEKAGIIKDGIPIVSSRQKKEAMEVILNVANYKNSPVEFIDRIYKILDTRISLEGTYAVVKGVRDNTNFEVSINMIGRQFIENLLLAYESVKYISLLPKEVLKGLKLSIKGRFEILNNDPLIVFDTAHTPRSVDFTIKNYIKILNARNEKTFNLVIAVMKDKEINKISKVIWKYKSNVMKFIILRLPENDGSGILVDNLTKLGIDNVLMLEKPYIEGNNLIIGSFRIYESIQKIIIR